MNELETTEIDAISGGMVIPSIIEWLARQFMAGRNPFMPGNEDPPMAYPLII